MKTSIIIATHARPDSLKRLLGSLASQIDTSRREVFIAENGTAQPAQIRPGIVEHRHLHEPRAGKCRIQNRALREAAGDIVVFLDDDLIVAPGYLDAVEAFFDSHREFAAMKGRILAAEDPERIVGPMSVYLDLPIVDHGDEVCEVRGVLGANMAFRASALNAVGPFDERLGPGACGHEEETEMSARLRRAGYRIGYAPAALVYHDVDPARADRERFITVARERGRCRMIHEDHSAFEVISKNAIAIARLRFAHLIGASMARIAREERRLAIARGMFDGLAVKVR
ncbi:MAG: glycosyltransferase [Candidatus Binatus sp.]|uniref:glycosyltransferase family 2 protein n=1 Tax=Candidatus Binatus sp. TaxID=2811406 RepID=UPI0027169893|nr:glycosyltransferase [Candidatus Binatus sp.]MDO8433175.1 glycosyltransferase [Candidatus Binatus sp.]